MSATKLDISVVSQQLIQAAVDDDVVTILGLLKSNADPGTSDSGNTITPLIAAVKNDDAEVVQAILAFPLLPRRIDHETNDGNNALIWAAMMNGCELIVALLNAGADVNYHSRTGLTPLIAAARFGELEAMELLVQRGADVNLHTPAGTALFACAKAGHLLGVKMLLRWYERVELFLCVCAYVDSPYLVERTCLPSTWVTVLHWRPPESIIAPLL
jgi:ankyrin repeat protein